MRHLVSGRKLKRTSSHRKALLRNLATDLIEHKRIVTTLAKAKELRPFAEQLITKAKHALVRERQNLLPEGQTIDIHNRRQAARIITRKSVVQELFDAVAPVVEARNGGYTRIVKLGHRRGDGGVSAMIELIDWSAPQDGVVALKGKKKVAKKAAKPAKAPKVEAAAPVAEVKEEAPVVAEIVDTPAPVVADAAPAVDAPVAEESNDASDAPKMTFDDTTEEEKA